MLDESDTEIPIVGTRGKEWLKITEDFQFEELGVYIRVKDFMDDQSKERLIGLAQAAMQNQQIDMIDYIRIEKAKTYTEIINELEYSLNKKKRDAEKQQAMMQMMQQAQMEQQMSQQQQLAGMKEEGANYRKELDVQGKVTDTAMKQALAEGGAPEAEMM